MTMENTRSRGRFPAGLAGAAVLVVAAEAWLAAQAAGLTTVSAACYRYSADAVARSPGRAVLCFGDSLVKIGVQPRLVAGRHGQGLNLACAGARPALTYVLLRRALEGGATPSAVLVDFHATQVQAGPMLDFEGMAEVLTLREAWDYSRECGDRTLFGRLAARRALPSLRLRDGLRGAVAARLAGKPVAEWGNFENPAYRDWDAHDGAHLTFPSATQGPDGLYSDERAFATLGPWACHPVNAVYIRKFLDLAASRRLPVYWLLPPIHPRLQARFDASGDSARYDQMVRNAVAYYRNLTVIDARHAGYDPAEFIDGTHLSATGSARFSRRVAGVLESDPPGSSGRQVVLKGPTTDGPVRR
jgi:lysophospholipase L1-like esterase